MPPRKPLPPRKDPRRGKNSDKKKTKYVGKRRKPDPRNPGGKT